MYFYFILVVVLSTLILSVKNGGGMSRGGFAYRTKSINRDESYLPTVPNRTIALWTHTLIF